MTEANFDSALARELNSFVELSKRDLVALQSKSRTEVSSKSGMSLAYPLCSIEAVKAQARVGASWSLSDGRKKPGSNATSKSACANTRRGFVCVGCRG
jgi:hypothetical protein